MAGVSQNRARLPFLRIPLTTGRSVEPDEVEIQITSSSSEDELPGCHVLVRRSSVRRKRPPLEEFTSNSSTDPSSQSSQSQEAAGRLEGKRPAAAIVKLNRNDGFATNRQSSKPYPQTSRQNRVPDSHAKSPEVVGVDLRCGSKEPSKDSQQSESSRESGVSYVIEDSSPDFSVPAHINRYCHLIDIIVMTLKLFDL